MEDREQFQALIDAGLPFAEQLLEEKGEHYPYGFGLKNNGELDWLNTFDGNNHIELPKAIESLKFELKERAIGYLAIAVFYDVKALHPHTNKKTNAIAAFIESRNEETAFDVYFPYQLNDQKELEFSESFGNPTDKEIFI